MSKKVNGLTFQSNSSVEINYLKCLDSDGHRQEARLFFLSHHPCLSPHHLHLTFH